MVRVAYQIHLFGWWKKGILKLLCSELISWSSSPSAFSSLGNLHHNKWYQLLLGCLSHVTKFCQFCLKLCPESWIFPPFFLNLLQFIVCSKPSLYYLCSYYCDRFITGLPFLASSPFLIFYVLDRDLWKISIISVSLPCLNSLVASYCS